MQNDGVKTYGKKGRRIRAANRLKAQLVSGQKRPKGYSNEYFVLLSDKDKNRIETELATLQTRI